MGLSREDLLLGWERYANSESADVNVQIEANKPEEQRFELNPDHTHYIIVRDDTIHRTGINQFTLRFERSVMLVNYHRDSDNIHCARSEEEIKRSLNEGFLLFFRVLAALGSRKNAKEDLDANGHAKAKRQPSAITMQLPLMAILIQGDTNSAKFIFDRLQKELPILVLEGTGGLADLIAFVYDEVQRRYVAIRRLREPRIDFCSIIVSLSCSLVRSWIFSRIAEPRMRAHSFWKSS